MKPETRKAIRVRILEQFLTRNIPDLVALNGADATEISIIRDFFADGILEGEITDEAGTDGILCIRLTRISEEAYTLVAESKSAARATETTRRIGIAVWKIVVGIILILSAVWAAIDHWPKIQELLGVSPHSKAK